MLPPGGEMCNCAHAASDFGMEALKAKTEAHEKETKREKCDCEQQHLTELDYTDLFCFFVLFCFSTFKGYFGSSMFEREQRPVVDLKFVNCHQQRLCTADGFAKCSHSVAPPTRPFA
ncbi:hypothetical protein INR49_000300 [Caranx melampygus]|nr:hypothetical protein INR49_000300 [Caranx melampygus]